MMKYYSIDFKCTDCNRNRYGWTLGLFSPYTYVMVGCSICKAHVRVDLPTYKGTKTTILANYPPLSVTIERKL